MNRRIFFTTAFALAAPMSLPGIADDAADESAIREIWRQYAALRVSGDAEGWLGLWDEDGIQMPPGVPARRIQTLRPGLAGAWAASPRDAMEVTPEEIVVAGDWAYTRGIYTTHAGATHMEGKFMTILRRQVDGSWRIYRDIFNPNG